MSATNSVTFRIDAPQADTVTIAGDFNQWDATSRPMRRRKDGVWWTVLRLGPGTHQYKFVINGVQWQEDPSNPNQVPNSLGGYNSVCEVS